MMNIVQGYYQSARADYWQAVDKAEEFINGRAIALDLDYANPEHEDVLTELEEEGRRLNRVGAKAMHLAEIEALLIKWGKLALKKFNPEKFKECLPVFESKSITVRHQLLDMFMKLETKEHPAKTLKVGLYKEN
jgi:hypothetical protein